MTGRAPQITSGELATWRRLAGLAAGVTAGKAGSLGDLQAAAKRARRCVVPGKLDRANPFVRLQRQAELYTTCKPGQREALEADLLALARECLAVLNTPPATGEAATPPRRGRADIDG